MILILCVDDRLGRSFNRRRQSRDRVLCGEILSVTRGKTLWMDRYSAGIFPENAEIRVAEDCLHRCGEGEYCFAELQALDLQALAPEGILLYRWNRVYPADVHLAFREEDWTLARRREFAGHSHDCITEELYLK